MFTFRGFVVNFQPKYMQYQILGSKTLIEKIHSFQKEGVFSLLISTRERWVSFETGSSTNCIQNIEQIWKLHEARKRFKQIDFWIDCERDAEIEAASLILFPTPEEMELIRWPPFYRQDKDQIEILWREGIVEYKGVDISE